MTTLLEFFDEHERRFKDAGAADLYRLKYFFEAREGVDVPRLEWEMNLFFRLMESLKPKRLRVSVEKTVEKPTLGPPTIIVRDSIGRDFSFWYKPYFLVPLSDGPKTIMLDLACMRGEHASMYSLGEKALGQFDSRNPVRETAVRLTTHLKPLQLTILTKPRFSAKDAGDVQAVSYFLKPRNMFLASQYPMPDMLKSSLPLNTRYAESVDINFQKFTDAVKPLL
ncbi:hypothetical protein HYS54_02275 [Candidatus Micrarchaeota archaeon]|nr:hypothetical protein [Candidatus Micrarchaeota archaeon]